VCYTSEGNFSHVRAGACSKGVECPSKPAGQAGELKQGRSIELSYPRDPKVTHDHYRWSRKGQSCRDLRGQLGTRKEAPIVDTRNVEGAQGNCLWLVGRRVVGGLTGRYSGDLDCAIPALLC